MNNTANNKVYLKDDISFVYLSTPQKLRRLQAPFDNSSGAR